MTDQTVREPLRDRLAEAMWPREDFGAWEDLSEEAREMYRRDADRGIALLRASAVRMDQYDVAFGGKGRAGKAWLKMLDTA